MSEEKVESSTEKADGAQAESAEEKLKVKAEDKGKQKGKTDENAEKPNGRAANNNESGNCYW